MNTKIRNFGVVAVSAGAVASVVIAATSVGAHNRDADPTASSHSTPGVTHGAAAASAQSTSDTPGLSPATVAALESSGVVVETSELDKSSVTGLDAAVQTAKKEFPGMLTDESGPVQASPVAVSIGEYGKQLQPDPRKPSQILPNINHRPAWVLVFDNVHVPLMGSFNEDESKSVPTPAPSRFVVLIDGVTGAFLNARTF